MPARRKRRRGSREDRQAGSIRALEKLKEGSQEGTGEGATKAPRPKKVTGKEIRETCQKLGLDPEFILTRLHRADRGKLNRAVEMLGEKKSVWSDEKQGSVMRSQLDELRAMKSDPSSSPEKVNNQLIKFIQENLSKV